MIVTCPYRYGNEVPIEFERFSYSVSHHFATFDCGNPAINTYIRDDLDAIGSVSYVFIDTNLNRAIAYCSLSCTGIIEQLDDGTGTIYSSTRPAIEIEFFAVDENYKGLPFDEDSDEYETLSSSMFMYCIQRAASISRTVIGAEMVVLYSVPRAVSFYERNGFRRFCTNMEINKDPFVDGCVPMYYLL